jgi:excisionase family DNA binding protein
LWRRDFGIEVDQLTRLWTTAQLDSIDVDELLPVAEIAERLKVNQQTARNWIDRGGSPAYALGGGGLLPGR